MGAGSSALWLPRSLRANPLDVPERLLVVMSMQGTEYSGWKMRPPGVADDVDFEMDLSALAEDEFSRALAPLHRYRDRLVALDGLALLSAQASTIEPHAAGQASALTGYLPYTDDPERGRGPSIDRIISDAITRPGQFGSVDLMTAHRDEVMVFDGDGNPWPIASYLSEDWAGVSGDPLAADYVDRVVERTMGRGERRARGLEDDRRVSQHLDMLSDAVRQFDSASACESGSYSRRTFETVVQTAFACDLTRVATLHMRTLTADQIGAPPGDVHTDYAHATREDPAAREYMVRNAIQYSEQFVQILDALDAVPEGDGTLLDHTTVVWVSELGDGSHGFDPWPVVIAGGTKFRGGRYLRWAPTVSGFEEYYEAQGRAEQGENRLAGVPHQDLLVRILQEFGVTGSDGNLINQIGHETIALPNGDILPVSGPIGRL